MAGRSHSLQIRALADVLDTAVTEVGDYVLTVTAVNGCTATALATVMADLELPMDVNATGGILSCTAGMLTLMGELEFPAFKFKM